MVGLETALPVCLGAGGRDARWLSLVVDRLTAGPYRVLAQASAVPAPGLPIGEPATCVLFDPAEEWRVTAAGLRSLSRNTPLLDRTVRGQVLLTMVDGVVAHVDSRRLAVFEGALHG
jgi:dihydroorotase